ncbi:leucyl aminopeptidase [Agromyces sp. MMS24-JH15]|uniref:leucyl aminopeptidase n=1 Tax=Agromyces sp. MMS24-JH15 TaxID=3243765 RepID=UPI003748E7FF
MPAVPHLSLAPLDAAGDDVVLLASAPGADGPRLLAGEGWDWVAEALVALGAKGSSDELIRLPGRDGVRLVAVAGTGGATDAPGLRLAAGSALRQLADAEHVRIAIPVDDAEVAAAVLEGAGLGAYRYNEYRSKPARAARAISLATELSEEEIGLRRIRSVVEAVARTKDLVNASPADLSPDVFAALAADAAAEVGISARVLAEPELRDGGFGGILGVGQGSVRPPRLVRLESSPEGARFRLALIGKGITFDSGGLSLKPGGSMVGMKADMSGAAAVLAAMVALAQLDVPIAVTGWLCLAENMPSGTALRPNDVLRMHGGTTVEVLNTDAEGRLVMADALVAASREQPDAIVDVATLTGAQTVALGTRTAGLMGDDALVDAVRSAAGEVDESVWPMPLPAYLRALLKSEVADLANAKLGTVIPGMLVAGVFLQEFVGTRDGSDERIPWAHLDIAGPADNTGAGWGYTATGPTGAAVRTLVRLAERLAER